MIAARARQFTLVVHSIDDSGALCGARPDGRWRESGLIPVNCPKCLRAMSTPRFAICETPASRTSARHVRRVGLEGIGGAFGGKTLCGAVVGWDVGELAPDQGIDGLCPACGSALRREKVRLAS